MDNSVLLPVGADSSAWARNSRIVQPKRRWKVAPRCEGEQKPMRSESAVIDCAPPRRAGELFDYDHIPTPYREHVDAYLLSIGVPQEQIDAIREIMLEPGRP